MWHSGRLHHAAHAGHVLCLCRGFGCQAEEMAGIRVTRKETEKIKLLFSHIRGFSPSSSCGPLTTSKFSLLSGATLQCPEAMSMGGSQTDSCAVMWRVTGCRVWGLGRDRQWRWGSISRALGLWRWPPGVVRSGSQTFLKPQWREGGRWGQGTWGAARWEQCVRTEQWEHCAPLLPPSQLCSSASQDSLRPSLVPRTSSSPSCRTP